MKYALFVYDDRDTWHDLPASTGARSTTRTSTGPWTPVRQRCSRTTGSVHPG
jgi:hypothetical protein